LGHSQGGNRNDIELWRDANIDSKFSTEDVILGDSIFRGLNKKTSDIQTKILVVTPKNNSTDLKEKAMSQRITCLRLSSQQGDC